MSYCQRLINPVLMDVMRNHCLGQRRILLIINGAGGIKTNSKSRTIHRGDGSIDYLIIVIVELKIPPPPKKKKKKKKNSHLQLSWRGLCGGGKYSGIIYSSQ